MLNKRAKSLRVLLALALPAIVTVPIAGYYLYKQWRKADDYMGDIDEWLDSITDEVIRDID